MVKKQHVYVNHKGFSVSSGHLSLSSNKIRRISDVFGLKRFTGLQELNLAFNGITEIEGLERF